ncbi:MAG: hypothetical protein IKB22_09625 [Lentisphaeria bacterium]|nr:hypothetical protein [Lentisphaeria bacterium]
MWTTKLTARCADVPEGQELIRNRTLYHGQINKKTLEFLLQRKGGTLEEYIEFSALQVLPFTAEEEKRVQDTMEWIDQMLGSHGLKLPDPGPLTFVKTTGEEELGATGYTCEGVIFLNKDAYSISEAEDYNFHLIVLHELSHCLSRLFPEYRQALYSLIHFTVLDHDIEIPEEVFEQIIANPDVEHHNSFATFTINGEKKDCYIVSLTDSVFEKKGDNFLLGNHPGIVPLGTTTVYNMDQVEDFWKVFGQNTTYVIDPEEASANHFAFALMTLDEGYGRFRNPEILEGVIKYLKR